MKTLATAAIVALSLTILSPAMSLAGINGNGHNGYGNGNNCPNNHRVPEPGTMALLGTAIGAIYLKKRKSEE